MNSSKKQRRNMKSEFPLSRGDSLERLDYHEEFKPGIKHLFQKPLDHLVGQLRERRPGWAITVAVLDPSTSAAGAFVSRLLENGIGREDKLTLVATTTSGFDERIQEQVFGPSPAFETRPRMRSWLQKSVRDDLSRDYFDMVFISAETDAELSAAEALSRYSSLVVVNRDGQRFVDYATTETEANRPVFSFSERAQHLSPLMSDGTPESMQEYVRLAAVCEKSEGGRCSEERCPAQAASELILRKLAQG